MEDFAELRELADRSDALTRRRIHRFIEMRQKLAELTGDETIHEATFRLDILFERHPARREIVQTAERLRYLGRITFSVLEQ